MSFMQREVYFGQYYSVETFAGTCIIPIEVSGVVRSLDDLVDYCEGTIRSDEDNADWDALKSGWLARMTAPGYMDCTDWSAHPTEEDAESYLADMYGDEDDEDE